MTSSANWYQNKINNLFEKIIIEEENKWLNSIPSAQEIQQVIKSLNYSSKAHGHDGLNGEFHKKIWDITKSIRGEVCSTIL